MLLKSFTHTNAKSAPGSRPRLSISGNVSPSRSDSQLSTHNNNNNNNNTFEFTRKRKHSEIIHESLDKFRLDRASGIDDGDYFSIDLLSDSSHVISTREEHERKQHQSYSSLPTPLSEPGR